MKIQNTASIEHPRIKCVVHGPAGVGKTRLAATASRPLVLSAEDGLLSVHDDGIDFVDVSSQADVMSAYRELRDSAEIQSSYDWIILDSASEIAEITLASLKKSKPDPRQAYGALYDEVPAMFRAFRDLPFDVLFIAKQLRTEVDGGVLYEPSIAAQKMGQAVPYLFDEVWAMHARENLETRQIERALRTRTDGKYSAKDRSGKLDEIEPPDLEAIRAKILGPRQG